MMQKKRGLGRGLESVFASSDAGQDSASVLLPVSDVEPDKNQPRKHFEPDSLQELTASVEKHGVLQPITVRPNPAGGYQIIAGERRWRAAREAGLREIPAIIREVSDADAIEMALIENLQREDLNPVEEAFGYRQMMKICGLTQEQAAEKLCRSRPAVANSLRLLTLPESVQHLVREGQLTAGHARAVLTVPGDEAKTAAAKQIVEQNLNVRQAEALCRRLSKPKAPKAPPRRPVFAQEAELSLREALGTRVRISCRGKRGTLAVDYSNEEQLKAFAKLLGKYEKEKKKND